MKCNRCGSKPQLVCRACGSHWCKDCHKAASGWNYFGNGTCANCGEKEVVFVK